MAIIWNNGINDPEADKAVANDYSGVIGITERFGLGQKQGLETLTPNLALRYSQMKLSGPTEDNPVISEEDWKTSPFYREGLKYYPAALIQ